VLWLGQFLGFEWSDCPDSYFSHKFGFKTFLVCNFAELSCFRSTLCRSATSAGSFMSLFLLLVGAQVTNTYYLIYSSQIWTYVLQTIDLRED
jgi:hypothetical protein